MFNEEAIGSATVLARVEEISRRTDHFTVPATDGAAGFSPELVIATVQVVETIRGTLPPQIDINLGLPHSDCGGDERFVADTVISLYSAEQGPWVGDGRYFAHYGRLTREEFAAATTPGPVHSVGPATTLVFGRRGGSSVMTVDDHGLAVAYGEGPGPIFAASVCPGGEFSVELAGNWVETSLLLRRLSDLAVVRGELLPRDVVGSSAFARGRVRTLSCGDPAGDTVVLSGRAVPPEHVDEQIEEPVSTIRHHGQLTDLSTPLMALLANPATGQLVGIGTDHHLKILDLTGALLREHVIGQEVITLAISNDGRRVAMALPSVSQPVEPYENRGRPNVDAVLVGPVEGPWDRVAVAHGTMVSLSAHLGDGFLITTGHTTQLISPDGTGVTVTARREWSESKDDVLAAHLTPGGTALAAMTTRRNSVMVAPDVPQVQDYGFQALGFVDVGPSLATTIAPTLRPAGGVVSTSSDREPYPTPGAAGEGQANPRGEGWIPGTGGRRLSLLALAVVGLVVGLVVAAVIGVGGVAGPIGAFRRWARRATA